MRLFQTTAVLLAVGSSVWGAADPQLLGLLMPDAKIVAGVQLGQAKASAFGQFVLSQAGPMAELDKLKAATGFDPRTDLTEMVAGSTGPGAGLVAGHGSFQVGQLAALASRTGAVTENYRGITLMGGTGAERVAFLDGTTVVIGDGASVKAAVDRWIGGRATGALTARAVEISATSQAWAVAAGLSELQGKPAANAPPEAQMMQNVLGKIGQVSGGLNFGGTITMHGQAQTGSAQDAQALADVLRLLITMAAPQAPLPVMPEVSASANNVNFTLQLTEQMAEQLFQPKGAVRGARRQ